MKGQVYRNQLTSFLERKGYKHAYTDTESKVCVYKLGGFPPIKVPPQQVIQTSYIKAAVLTDRKLFAEFVESL
jgi:hypothetical protein